MQCVFVSTGIDGDRADAHPTGRFDYAASDLAAVGNQNLLEHVELLIRSCSPAAC
jgi:hypothetical protein